MGACPSGADDVRLGAVLAPPHFEGAARRELEAEEVVHGRAGHVHLPFLDEANRSAKIRDVRFMGQQPVAHTVAWYDVNCQLR